MAGYNAPQNLQNYAIYLDSRIRAYRDLKHDAVRVQAESNRDMRNNNSIEEDMAYRGERPSNKTTPTRSKTIMGRKLRVMTVEKGLLRETKAVQRMIDSLVECRVCFLLFSWFSWWAMLTHSIVRSFI
jgi:phosphatidylinositol-binding clathrin assembly protein